MRELTAEPPAPAPETIAEPAPGDAGTASPPPQDGLRARPDGDPPTRARSELREEIQALRALAVALVVAYHLWPSGVPGGFVGVDVFFAISGFLITGMLVREVDRRGRISLAGFWARRARRLLPAALLTVVACAVVTILVVPVTAWQHFFAEMRASTLYVQNWQLAAQATDYFAADDAASPVQHFWSLSAEEQFYLAWPLLIVAALALARGRSRRLTRASIGFVLLAFTGLSVWWSIRATAADPSVAYYATPTRAWEFGAGGLLALAAPHAGGRAGVRALLSWLGLGAIVVAAFAYSDDTAFPGWAALLPVLGAVAVIRAGAPGRRWAPTPLLRRRTVQFVGGISYSVYLWHWPFIVLAPFVLGRAIDVPVGAAIVAATILAAWLTKLLVEDPARTTALLTRRRPRRTLVLAALATAAVAGLTVWGSLRVDARADADARATQRALDVVPRCFGAASRDPRRPCDNPRLRAMVVPTPLEAVDSGNGPCTIVERHDRLAVCAFGAPPARARATVAVVGDSHGAALRPALARVARQRGWRALSITRSGCAFTFAVRDTPEPARSHCIAWNRQVRRWFAAHPEVTAVIAAARSGDLVVPRSGHGMFATKVMGFATAWSTLPANVRRILVIRDTPLMGEATNACVEQALVQGAPPNAACAVPRHEALVGDAQAAAAENSRSRRTRVIDLTPQLCDRTRCLPVVGGALAFRDRDHLTPEFAASLGPILAREIDRALR